MKTILVAEDNPRLLASYVRVLETQFQVLQAQNKAMAIGTLARDLDHDIAAVVSDYDLGDGTGAEILCWVLRERPNLPFYLCTGSAAMDLGVPTFHKPFDIGELLKALSAELLASEDHLSSLKASQVVAKK